MSCNACWAAGFTSVLFAVSRILCSSFRFLEIIMAMCTGSSWNRSCRDVHSKHSTYCSYSVIQCHKNDGLSQYERRCRLTCRFLLILRMLCCSRNLFSRAKRLCWSSNWARRSWNRTIARESCNATVSLERNIFKRLPDAPHAQPR